MCMRSPVKIHTHTAWSPLERRHYTVLYAAPGPFFNAFMSPPPL